MLSDYKTLLLRGIAVLIISCLGLGIHYLKPKENIRIIEKAPPTKPIVINKVTVHITGAVQQPGVYPLTSPVRLIDLLKKAGGPTPDANLNAVNLAQHLNDAQKIHIPYLEPSYLPQQRTTPRVSINTARSTQLTTLRGIGPKTAKSIVQYRATHGQFRTINDLTKVKGIGPKQLEKLRPYIQL